MPTFKLYKDGKQVQGQFYLLYNLFFFSKDKNLWSRNNRQTVVKEMCYLNGMLIMASIRCLGNGEGDMLFSHVKISCFRTKAHLVFHRCLYEKRE